MIQTDVSQCREAILAFWRANDRVLGYPFNESRAVKRAKQDAAELAEGQDDGFRYGGPGWPELKLHFDQERGFWLEANGMGDSFYDFQDVVDEEFTKAGLELFRMPA